MRPPAAGEEFLFAVHDRTLAGKVWGAPGRPPVLALHGWRDNAATFDRLAPELAPTLRVIAPDLPGHGRSSPRHRDGTYEIWSYVEDVLALLDLLALERVTLLGHSMGGAVACLFAAAFPEHVARLVLLDSLGPLSTMPEDAPAQMRKSLIQKRQWSPAERSYYPSADAAITARARIGLEFDSAALLAARNLGEEPRGWFWQSDRRLARANPLSLSEEQVQAFLRRIQCPALMVKATGGDYWDKHAAVYEQRIACFADLRVAELPGHHHQHLEGQVMEVAGVVRDFVIPAHAGIH
jgi:pimeloyl-ACP methyl ester carboxylesterase